MIHKLEGPARPLFAAAVLLAMVAVPAHAIDWPQEIKAEEGTIVVYQPQPEELTGNTLTGRAAMSIELDGTSGSRTYAGPTRRTPTSSDSPRS